MTDPDRLRQQVCECGDEQSQHRTDLPWPRNAYCVRCNCPAYRAAALRAQEPTT